MKIVIGWASSIFVITLFMGTLYVVVWQVWRQSANDPQITLAERRVATLGWMIAGSWLVGIVGVLIWDGLLALARQNSSTTPERRLE